MTRIYRLIALVLLLALLLGFSGCARLLDYVQSFTKPPVEFKPTVYTDTIKTAFEESYGDQLSPNEKCIYDALLALSPGEDKVVVTFPEVPALCARREPTKEESEALTQKISYWTANALYAMWLDFPEIFWINHNKYNYTYEIKSDEDGIVKLTKLTLNLSLSKTKEAILADIAALNAATADFQAKGSTPADKVAYINNYLSSRIEYALGAPNRASIIGALVDRRCVCEGYARAFAYLAKKAGLAVVNIPGYGTIDGDTEGHMWNGVLIDGVMYAVDVTWNDTAGKNLYLLVGTETVCGSTTFGESHVPDMLTIDSPHKPFALPAIGAHAYGVEQENEN